MLQKLKEKNFDEELFKVLTKKNNKDKERKPGRSANTSI